MLTKNEHFIKLQKKVAKKIEEKLGIAINKSLSDINTLRYDVDVKAIHKLTAKVATKYCEKHGLSEPKVSHDCVKIMGGTFSGFVDSGSRYVIFNW